MARKKNEEERGVDCVKGGGNGREKKKSGWCVSAKWKEKGEEEREKERKMERRQKSGGKREN
jgi:hypothetical protein